MLGLLDQSIVSGANFITALALARKLDVNEYGLYVMVMGLILALNSVQSALISFPFTVSYAGAQASIWRTSVLRHLLIGTGTMGFQTPAIFLGCLYLRHSSVTLPAAGALYFWQAQDFLRRAMFQQGHYRMAFIMDSVRYVIPALTVVLLPKALLSTVQMLVLIASTGALASLACGVLLIHRPGNVTVGAIKSDIVNLWRIGRAIILFNLSSSGLMQGCAWILGNVSGLPAASQYQAINNVMGVTNPAVQGISVVRDPAVAREYLQHGPATAIRHALRYAIAVGLIVTPILAFFVGAPAWALSRFYGSGSPYALLTKPLQIAAVAQILAISSQFGAGILACIGHSHVIWRVQALANAACLAVMLPVVRQGGLSGCLVTLALFNALALAAMLRNLGIAYRRDPTPRGLDRPVAASA